MPEFSEVMDALLTLQKAFPEMEWKPKDGIVEINLYVGIANTDLLRDAMSMFAPA